MKHIIGNESGLTLVEIMIAGAITISLGLAIAEMQTQQSRSQVSLEVKASQQDFNNLLKFKILNSALKTLPATP